MRVRIVEGNVDIHEFKLRVDQRRVKRCRRERPHSGLAPQALCNLQMIAGWPASCHLAGRCSLGLPCRPLTMAEIQTVDRGCPAFAFLAIRSGAMGGAEMAVRSHWIIAAEVPPEIVA